MKIRWVVGRAQQRILGGSVGGRVVMGECVHAGSGEAGAGRANQTTRTAMQRVGDSSSMDSMDIITLGLFLFDGLLSTE